MNLKTIKINIKNASMLTGRVRIEKPVEFVFDYIIYKLKDNYNAIAEGHIKYEMINSEFLREGTEIDCQEKAANQTAHHLYKVDKIIENECISYSSIPSKIFIELPWQTIETFSNTYCRYDFEKINSDTTLLQLIIAIQFKSRFEKIYSTLFGGIAPWKKHQKEELEKLKEIIENE